MTLRERVLDLILLENINPNQFYTLTGLGNGWIDKVGLRLKKPSIEKISKTFPRWNIDYLQTGIGEKYSESQTTYLKDIKNNIDFNSIITRQQETIYILSQCVADHNKDVLYLQKEIEKLSHKIDDVIQNKIKSQDR
jgi:hypothetical protein